jgi:pyruvate decarboxylase
VLAKQVRKNEASLLQYQNESKQAMEASAVAPSPPERDANAPLKRVEMMRQIQEYLDGRTTLLVESGEAWFDGEDMHLPDGARFEIAMQWGSIGWSVPATFGYALGVEPGRRIVSLIGDGSFRFTAQVLATAIGCGVDNMTIFINNNQGYVSESAIHDGPYNYYPNWDFSGLMSVFNAGKARGLGLKATTAGELADAIQKAREHTGGPVLIECQLAHDDYHPKMNEWGKKVSQANSRAPVRSV